jgi:inner membrane protease subunit 2
MGPLQLIRMATKPMFSKLRGYRPSRASTRDFSLYCFAFVSWVPAIIFFNQHVAEHASISGQSMYPYLNTGYNETLRKDICLVNKWNPAKNLKRGMLVTYWLVLALSYGF